ncbi:P-loop NTPase [Haloplanus aerogenes]|uniref:Chromosome partitioning protein ParA n=1 Tax=Haloplanus aerogenes TaxID=660522 RepID=A0A3M0D1R5_9EURY|nr:P-loop NTPase [Haloplanus aerogenes]AZH23865.1 chromosome partitioning protein ParA [Haloplanus aerogenes]RMB13376.1 septum site-determining protein MinD [Haloplanus aerogenes]
MIVAVAGGKGGVGKTTVAYNLGAALDAVVVDADLGMADLPRGRGPDLHDVLAEQAEATEAIRGSPVSILPCGRSLAGARGADVGKLADTLRTVADERGDVVVDCPAGMRADVGVPLAVADASVLVASPRQFALADAVRTRELARELDAGLVGVALNRTTDADDPPVDVFRRVLGAPISTVPADPRVGRSVDEERPVVTAAPESVAADAVRSLADGVRKAHRPRP